MTNQTVIAAGGARTFLSAAAPERSPAPETTVARKLPQVAADKNVRAPMHHRQAALFLPKS
jgi:hypothetical protein